MPKIPTWPTYDSTLLYSLILIDKVPRFLELGWMVWDGGQGKYHGGYLILTSSVFQCWGVVYCCTGPWWACGEGIKMCGTYQDNSTTQTFLSSKIYGKNSTGQGSINQYNSNCFKNDKMRYVCASKYILKSWNNGKEVPRWGVAEIQKMSPSTTGRCYCCH